MNSTSLKSNVEEKLKWRWVWLLKWAIHPSQIEIAQQVFSPTQDMVNSARKQKEAYAEALTQGLGAISVDGMMVDAASIRIQQNIIDKADLIGM